MYTATYYDKDNRIVHLWDDTRGYIKVPYRRYGFVKDPNGDFKTLFGDRVKKIYSGLRDYDPEDIFESDIRAETRILVDMYLNDNSVAKNNLMFIDIEVMKTTSGQYSSTSQAKGVINAITLEDKTRKKIYTLILDNSITEDVEKTVIIQGEILYKCKTESVLLSFFLSLYENINPSIISGWNSDYYDMPYLYERIGKVLSKKDANRLSTIGIVNKFDYGSRKYRIEIAGKNLLDYMLLYKKFVQNREASYKLDNIAKKVLGYGKVEYKGSLDNLYKNDPAKFVEYNKQDVTLISKMDDILKYIDLCLGICHEGHVPYSAIFTPSVYIDGSSLVELRKVNIVAPNTKYSGGGDVDEEADDEKFAGASVKAPMRGLHKWLYDLDLTSLYPSIMRSLNISPETKIGKMNEWDTNDMYSNKNDGKKVTLTYINGKKRESTIAEIKTFLIEKNYSISSNGVLYRNDKRGFIPSILDKWFAERVEFNRLKDEAKKNGDKNAATFYDIRQNIKKRQLNIFFGVQGLPNFRYYDLDNAEAITLTGQHIIGFSIKATNAFYNRKLDTQGVDYVAYSDTDSVRGDSMLRSDIYGERSISELFNLYEYCEDSSYTIDISNREFVFPNDLNLPYYIDGIIKYGKVDYMERHLIKKEQFKIKTKSGKQIFVTKDHSIMVLNDIGKIIEKKPNELSVNDKVVSIKFEIAETDEIAEIESLGVIEDYMYDIGMVDTPHTFFANDILVHNSVIVSSNPFIEKFGKSKEEDDEIIKVALDIIGEVQEYINSKYEILAKKGLNITAKHYLNIKQEWIAKSGFFISSKKRYALKKVHEKGFKFDHPEYSYTGIEMVRSDFPIQYKVVLGDILQSILDLKDKFEIDTKIFDFKGKLKDITDIEGIMMLKGVKEVTKYDTPAQSASGVTQLVTFSQSVSEFVKGTPIHVKSAINYNTLLRELKLENYIPINDDDKIKYTYLLKNPYNFETIALPEDEFPQEVYDFIATYINNEENFRSILIKKLESYYNALGWGIVSEQSLNPFFEI